MWINDFLLIKNTSVTFSVRSTMLQPDNLLMTECWLFISLWQVSLTDKVPHTAVCGTGDSRCVSKCAKENKDKRYEAYIHSHPMREKDTFTPPHTLPRRDKGCEASTNGKTDKRGERNEAACCRPFDQRRKKVHWRLQTQQLDVIWILKEENTITSSTMHTFQLEPADDNWEMISGFLF